jgi:uncharacterized protein (TIGR00251 family)
MASRLSLKIVPGASRDGIAGWLGERLKIRVRAAAERGKANKAVERVLADALGIPLAEVRIVSGATSARKTAEVSGLSHDEIRLRIGNPE